MVRLEFRCNEWSKLAANNSNFCNWLQFGVSAVHDDVATAGKPSRSFCDSTRVDTEFHATTWRSPTANAVQSWRRRHDKSREKCQ